MVFLVFLVWRCSSISQLINKPFPGEGEIGCHVILPLPLEYFLLQLEGAVLSDLVPLANVNINNFPAARKWKMEDKLQDKFRLT